MRVRAGQEAMWPVIDGRDWCPAFTDPRVAQVPAERVGLRPRHLRQTQAPGSPTGAVVPQAGALSTLVLHPFEQNSASVELPRLQVDHPGVSPAPPPPPVPPERVYEEDERQGG